ncbi:hypothetical protein NMY22_g793 [Coprinellus aureogranulatus]|nr:hypothetical protein NMY22_g793 [Coprinellus aureogranulatus]
MTQGVTTSSSIILTCPLPFFSNELIFRNETQHNSVASGDQPSQPSNPANFNEAGSLRELKMGHASDVLNCNGFLGRGRYALRVQATSISPHLDGGSGYGRTVCFVILFWGSFSLQLISSLVSFFVPGVHFVASEQMDRYEEVKVKVRGRGLYSRQPRREDVNRTGSRTELAILTRLDEVAWYCLLDCSLDDRGSGLHNVSPIDTDKHTVRVLMTTERRTSKRIRKQILRERKTGEALFNLRIPGFGQALSGAGLSAGGLRELVFSIDLHISLHNSLPSIKSIGSQLSSVTELADGEVNQRTRRSAEPHLGKASDDRGAPPTAG